MASLPVAYYLAMFMAGAIVVGLAALEMRAKWSVENERIGLAWQLQNSGICENR